MSFYGFYFTLIELILFGILLLTFIYQVYYHIRYLRVVIMLTKKISKNKIKFQPERLPVSVIICAKDELENLTKFLPFVLAQEYPEFEVIVVNDGSTDNTDIFLSELKKLHPNLRTTFVPAGATNFSTKKLAITLGIKAAKYDWLLFTDADCMPESTQWIERMARNFTPGVEFVLGYGAYIQKKGFVNKLITYDTLIVALQYLGFAHAGKPYMGVGRNLAYRKEVFFREKGFASTLNIRSGDDDLMVNKAANKFNTRIEVSHQSVTFSEPNTNFYSWFFQKERHLSVSSFYTIASKLNLAIEPFLRGLFYATFILSIIFGNIVIVTASLVLLISRFIVQLSVVNGSASILGCRKYNIDLLFFDIFLPLNSLFILLFGKMGSKAKNIRWK